jgi:hypothetical protein
MANGPGDRCRAALKVEGKIVSGEMQMFPSKRFGQRQMRRRALGVSVSHQVSGVGMMLLP